MCDDGPQLNARDGTWRIEMNRWVTHIGGVEAFVEHIVIDKGS